MAEFKEPCLLVIDNANDVNDLENHYQALRRSSNFHLLLTTCIILNTRCQRIMPSNGKSRT